MYRIVKYRYEEKKPRLGWLHALAVPQPEAAKEAVSCNLSSVSYLMSVRVELLLDQADKVPLDPRSIMPNKI